MLSRRLCVYLASAACILCAACAGFVVYRIDSLNVPNRSGRLGNGMRVTVQPDADQAEVLVTLRYDVGAAHEPPARKGLAHLVEHLAFRLGDELVDVPATPTPVAKEVAGEQGEPKPKKLRRVTHLVTENAYTSLDETVYWKLVAPEDVEVTLADLAKQMGDFSGLIDPEVFATEKEVVRNERRARYEGQPLDRVWQDVFDLFFPEGHPYHGGVIGSHDSISAITTADVQIFLEAHYHPANATLAVVGPVDAQQVLDQVMKLFGGKPRREPSKLAPVAIPTGLREETVVVPSAKQTLVTVVWPLGPRYSEEAEAIKLLDDAISGWFSYRLVQNREWAYWVYSFVDEQRLGSMYVVSALLRDHDDLDAVKAKIFEIAELMDSAVEPQYLGMARRRSVYSKLYEVEGQGERAAGMAAFFSDFGKPDGWLTRIKGLESMEMPAVRKLAGGLLDRERAFVLVLTPMAGEVAAEKSAESYSKKAISESGGSRLVHEDRDRPEPLYDFAESFDAFSASAWRAASHWDRARTFTLQNGIRCSVMQAGLVPLMSVTVAAPGGMALQPERLRGVARLLLDTMELPSGNARDDLYRMAARRRASAESEYLTVTQQFPSVYAHEGIETLARLLASPNLSRAALSDTRAQLLRSLATEAQSDLDVLASRAFLRARGLLALAAPVTRATAANVGISDLGEYRDRVFYPENLWVGVSSDLTVERVQELLQQGLGGWKPEGREPVDLGSLAPPPPDAPPPGVVVVPLKESVQSTVLLALGAPGWMDWRESLKAEAVAELLDEKASRLRQAMGVTYDVSVGLASYRATGVLQIRSRVERSATAPAMRQVVKVADELRRRPVTRQELDFVRRSLIRRYAQYSRTTMEESEHLALTVMKGRALSHPREVVDWLARLTLEELQAVVDRLLASPPVLVVVGEQPDDAALATLPAPLSGKTQRLLPEELL